MEKKLKQSLIYKGKLLSLEVIEVVMPSGFRTSREIVYHPGAVGILALNEEGHFLMVRQYRTALQGYIWEIPAGKLEKGESPLTCAQRELLEETGYEAKNWQFLLAFYPSPGYSSEVIHLFLAKGLIEKQPKFEADEEITISFFSPQDLEKLLKSSQPLDGKTALALMFLRQQGVKQGNSNYP